MPGIREAHVLISYPSQLKDQMMVARTALEQTLAKQLAKDCGIPQPFVEICICGSRSLQDIHIRIDGLDNVCGSAVQPRRDAIALVERTVMQHAVGVSVETSDYDTVSALREHPERLMQYHATHIPAPQLQ